VSGDCDSERQPEIAIWPSKPKYLPGTMSDSVEIPTTNPVF